MRKLYILYQARCHHCAASRAWLEKQAAYIPVEFIPAQSVAAQTKFPGLAQYDQTQPLLVITKEGDVYESSAAYIMSFYVLEKYRELSLRFAKPRLLPVARQIFELISTNTEAAVKWINSKSDEEIASALSAMPPMPCAPAPAPKAIAV